MNPALLRTWLFGPGADAAAHRAMTACGADVLIQDLEDSTPAARRPEARACAASLYREWRGAGAVLCARINALEADGRDDLVAVMDAGVQIVAYPKAVSAEQMSRDRHRAGRRCRRANRCCNGRNGIPW